MVQTIWPALAQQCSTVQQWSPVLVAPLPRACLVRLIGKTHQQCNRLQCSRLLVGPLPRAFLAMISLVCYEFFPPCLVLPTPLSVCDVSSPFFLNL